MKSSGMYRSNYLNIVLSQFKPGEKRRGLQWFKGSVKFGYFSRVGKKYM